MLDAVLSASRAGMGPPTVAPTDGRRTKPPKPTLQKLSKEDDIESYLDMFERVARQPGWPKELWTTQLAGLLSGEALDAFVSVPSETARSYDAVKEAILARFLVNAETYRLRFRGSHCRAGESYKLLLNRQTDLLKHWTQSAGSELNEIVLLEQFLLSLPTELAIKLRERNPATAKLAAEWADDYDLVHKGEEPAESKPLPRETEGAPKVPPRRSSLTGTPAKRGPGSSGNSLHSRTNTKGGATVLRLQGLGACCSLLPQEEILGSKSSE